MPAFKPSNQTDPNVARLRRELVQWSNDIDSEVSSAASVASLAASASSSGVRTLAPTGADDTSRLQKAISDCIADKKQLVLLPGTFKVSSSISIWDPVEIRGWNVGARWTDLRAAVTVLWTGASGYLFEIRGTVESTNTAGWTAEGVSIRNLLIRPSTSNTGNGIRIDGSTVDDANRRPARDIEFVDVAVRDFDGGIVIRGNCFDIALRRVISSPNASSTNHAFECLAAASVGTTGAGTISLYNCFFRSPGVGYKAAVLFKTVAVDCRFHGTDGIRMNGISKVIGCEHESEGSKATGSVGILVAGQSNYIQARTVGKYDIAIQIGDGTSASTQRTHGDVSYINDCNTGLLVTASGQRDGHLDVRFEDTVTTPITDNRLSTDGVREFFVYEALRRDTDPSPVFPIPPDVGIGVVSSAGVHEQVVRWDGTDVVRESRNSGGSVRQRMKIANRPADPEVWEIGEHSTGDPGYVRVRMRGQIYAQRVDHEPSGTTQTIDWDQGNVHKVDLESASGDVTLTLNNPQDGADYVVIVEQDSATARNIVWPSAVKWPGGSAPIISTGNNQVDLIRLVYDGDTTVYYATFWQNFS